MEGFIHRTEYFYRAFICLFVSARQPPVGQGLLIHQVPRTHNDTPQSVRLLWTVIGSPQRPLPDNTGHSQQTNVHVHGGIRIHNPSRRADADLRLRWRGHWDRLYSVYRTKFRVGEGKYEETDGCTNP
jgi:hypothetical protein